MRSSSSVANSRTSVRSERPTACSCVIAFWRRGLLPSVLGHVMRNAASRNDQSTASYAADCSLPAPSALSAGESPVSANRAGGFEAAVALMLHNLLPAAAESTASSGRPAAGAAAKPSENADAVGTPPMAMTLTASMATGLAISWAMTALVSDPRGAGGQDKKEGGRPPYRNLPSARMT